MAMVKHWAVYNQETNRNHPQDDAIVSDRTMREIYLPQFQAAVQPGHAAAVMCSYATVNGAYACENPHLGRVMDGEFGLQGFIASDWGATHSTVPSARAGLDMECRTVPATPDRWCRRCRTARCRWRRCGRWPGASSPRCSGSTCSARGGPGRPGAAVDQSRACRGRQEGSRAGHGAAQERRRRAAAPGRGRALDRGDRGRRRPGRDLRAAAAARRSPRLCDHPVPGHRGAGRHPHRGALRRGEPASRRRSPCDAGDRLPRRAGRAVLRQHHAGRPARGDRHGRGHLVRLARPPARGRGQRRRLVRAVDGRIIDAPATGRYELSFDGGRGNSTRLYVNGRWSSTDRPRRPGGPVRGT